MRVVSIDQRMKLRECCLPPEATSSRSMPVLLAPCQSAPPRTGLTRLPPLTWPPKGHEKGHKKDKAKAKQNFWLCFFFSLVLAIYVVWLAPQPPCHRSLPVWAQPTQRSKATQLRMAISGRAPPFDLSLVGLSLTGESEQAWATRQFPPRVSRA